MMLHFFIGYHMTFSIIHKTTLHHTVERKLAQDFLICRIIWLRLYDLLHFLFHYCHGLSPPLEA